MQDSTVKEIIAHQRQFFSQGETLSLEFRLEQLKKLKSIIELNEAEIIDALKKDLHKPKFESALIEIDYTLKELNQVIKNLKKWMKPQKVTTPFPYLWPGRSEIHFEPFGCVLIIGTWNYPWLLIISPLIGAMSAGNCAIVKPSEVATHSQNLISKLINENFQAEYITAIKAGPDQTQELLQEKFDYIFFTGGTQIGQKVMEAAAKHLTPVTLELGGKNPCIIDETADLDYAARRIAFAKITNAGQHCIAPDYLYVQNSVKHIFVEKLKDAFLLFYGKDLGENSEYTRIINKKHFDRLLKLMEKSHIIFGGKVRETDFYISPTLIDETTWDDPIMQEEIFGPLLPIMTFQHFDEIISILNSRPKSLALYFFTKNKQNETAALKQISFGGGCINECLAQVANLHLPFGGIGQSGIGNYHGKYSFETFSHKKSVYKKTALIDFKFVYPPYTSTKTKWFRRIFKLGG